MRTMSLARFMSVVAAFVVLLACTPVLWRGSITTHQTALAVAAMSLLATQARF